MRVGRNQSAQSAANCGWKLNENWMEIEAKSTACPKRLSSNESGPVLRLLGRLESGKWWKNSGNMD